MSEQSGNEAGNEGRSVTVALPERDRALNLAYRTLGYTQAQIDSPYFVAQSLRATVEISVDAALAVRGR